MSTTEEERKAIARERIKRYFRQVLFAVRLSRRIEVDLASRALSRVEASKKDNKHFDDKTPATTIFTLRSIERDCSSLAKWNTLVLLLLLWNVVNSPLRLAFELSVFIGPKAYTADYVTSMVFCLDVFVQSRVVVHIGGRRITDTKALRHMYLRSWTGFLDIFCAVPFVDFILFALGNADAVPFARILTWYRLTRIVRVSQALEKKISVSLAILKFVVMGFWMIFMIHVSACSWFAIGKYTATRGDRESWLIRYNMLDAHWTRQYLRSIYWSCATLATVGYGDLVGVTTAETIFSILVMVMGQVLSAFVIGTVTAVISGSETARTQFRAKISALHSYMRWRNLPEAIQQRITTYFEYTWSSSQGVDENEIFGELPAVLQSQVARYLHYDIVRNVPLFKTCDASFLNLLVTKLVHQVALVGDFIMNKGDMGSSMYIIARGSCAVLANGVQVAVLESGSFFGEIALLERQKRTATIQAIEITELYMLTSESLEQLFQVFPNHRYKIRTVAALITQARNAKSVVDSRTKYRIAATEVTEKKEMEEREREKERENAGTDRLSLVVDEKNVRRLSDARDREREGKQILSLPGEVGKDDMFSSHLKDMVSLKRDNKVNQESYGNIVADDPERLGEKNFISNEALWIIQSKKTSKQNQQNPLVTKRKTSVASAQESGKGKGKGRGSAKVTPVRGGAYLPGAQSSKPSATQKARFLDERSPASPSEISTEMKDFSDRGKRERDDDPPLLLTKRSNDEKVSRDSSLSLTSSVASNQEKVRLLNPEDKVSSSHHKMSSSHHAPGVSLSHHQHGGHVSLSRQTETSSHGTVMTSPHGGARTASSPHDHLLTSSSPYGPMTTSSLHNHMMTSSAAHEVMRAESSLLQDGKTFGSYEKKPWAIYPDNHFLKLLDITVILATVYNAFIVPVRICIEPDVFGDFTVHVCDYVADVIFIADMVSRFFRVKFSSGLLIDNLADIRKSYLHGRFFFDVLFCSPYDAIFLLFPATRKVHIYFRITRLYFLTKVRDKIDQWEKLLNYNTVSLRVVALSFWVVLLAHWIGCFFFLVGGRGLNEDSWIAADGIHTGTPTYRKWLRSFYWAATTMTTVGYGDIAGRTSTETLYTIFILIAGQIVFAMIIGSMSTLIANADLLRSAFKAKQDMVVAYSRWRRLPADLHLKITQYYDYLWSTNKGIDEETVLSSLSEPTRNDIAVFLHKKLIGGIPMFEHTLGDLSFARELVAHMSFKLSPPGDILVVQGVVGKQMFILAKGTCDVIIDSKKVSSLESPVSFGEMALLTSERRNATIVTTTYCEYFILEQENFDVIMADFPQYYAGFMWHVRQVNEKKEREIRERDLRERDHRDVLENTSDS